MNLYEDIGMELLHGYAFSPLAPARPIKIPVSPLIREVMADCFEQAEMALDDGGTPVGAGLINLETGQRWYERSDDKITNNILGHAEIKLLQKAQPVIGSRLGKCAVFSTTELCTMCTSAYAQGDIGTIIVAAARSALVREDGTAILRERKITSNSVLADSAAHCNAYSGYQPAVSVGLWQEYDRRNRAA